MPHTARCLFLRQRPHEWLEKYGDADGCTRWIASQREHAFEAKKTDGQLRREWRATERRARRDAWQEGWHCARGHDDTPRTFRDRGGEATYKPRIYVTRDELGPLAPEARGLPVAASPLYFIHQRVCRDYVATEAALVQLARRPLGNA